MSDQLCPHLVHRGDGEVGAPDFPDLGGGEPDTGALARLIVPWLIGKLVRPQARCRLGLESISVRLSRRSVETEPIRGSHDGYEARHTSCAHDIKPEVP